MKKKITASEKAIKQQEIDKKKHDAEFKKMKYLNKKAELEAINNNKHNKNIKKAKDFASKAEYTNIKSIKDCENINKRTNSRPYKTNSKYGSVSLKKALGAWKHIMKDNVNERGVSEIEKEYRKMHRGKNFNLGDGILDNATQKEIKKYINDWVEKIGTTRNANPFKEFCIKIPVPVDKLEAEKKRILTELAKEFDKFIKNYEVEVNGKKFKLIGSNGKKLFGSIHMNEIGEYHYQVCYENTFYDPEKKVWKWGIGFKPKKKDLFKFQKDLEKVMEPKAKELGLITENWVERLVGKALDGKPLTHLQHEELQSLGFEFDKDGNINAGLFAPQVKTKEVIPEEIKEAFRDGTDKEFNLENLKELIMEHNCKKLELTQSQVMNSKVIKGSDGKLYSINEVMKMVKEKDVRYKQALKELKELKQQKQEKKLPRVFFMKSRVDYGKELYLERGEDGGIYQITWDPEQQKETYRENYKKCRECWLGSTPEQEKRAKEINQLAMEKIQELKLLYKEYKEEIPWGQYLTQEEREMVLERVKNKQKEQEMDQKQEKQFSNSQNKERGGR